MLGRIAVGIVFHVLLLLITLTRAWLQQLPQTFSTIWLSRSHSLIFSLSLSLSFSLVSRSILSRRTNRRHIRPVCTTQLKSVECERYVWNENVEQEKAKPFKYSSSTSNIFRFLLHSLPKIGNYEFDIFFIVVFVAHHLCILIMML